jgi:hypothetical protein
MRTIMLYWGKFSGLAVVANQTCRYVGNGQIADMSVGKILVCLPQLAWLR